MPSSSGVGKQVFDPLLYDLDLPLCRNFYPLGFTVRVESNSRDILDAAAESWGPWKREFDSDPIRLRIAVTDDGELAIEPRFRAQQHLLTIVADRDNFACLDLQELFGFAVVSRATASDHAWLRWYFLEALAYCALSQKYVAPMHAAAVSRNGFGVLLFGPSAAGKSTLAFACAKAGWTFTSDDASSLLQDSGGCTAIGKPHQARFRDDAPQIFPELAPFATRARPNGKLSIEVPLDMFPQIQTAPSCEIGALVVLDRGHAPRLERIVGMDLLDEMTAEACFYGNGTKERHQRAVRRVLQKPAYRMHYRTLKEAIELLEVVAQ